jgi:hypothetical protein
VAFPKVDLITGRQADTFILNTKTNRLRGALEKFRTDGLGKGTTQICMKQRERSNYSEVIEFHGSFGPTIQDSLLLVYSHIKYKKIIERGGANQVSSDLN